MKSAADAEVVIKFNCKGLDEMQAAKKLADLPKEKPSLDSLMSRAGELSRDGKDEAGAVKVYALAARLYPDNPMLLNGFAWLLLTAKDKAVRDAKRALPVAREAVKLSAEKDGNILDTLAMALHDTGDLAEAARYAKLAAEKVPDNEEVVKRAKEYAKDAEKGK